MTADDLRAFLTQRGLEFTESAIPYGTRFQTRVGEIFNVYDSGKVTIQGKATELAKEVGMRSRSPGTGSEPSTADSASGSGIDNRVFIVYGHDLTARDTLELVLRRMGMSPIVLGNLPAGGDTIIEKLEQYLGREGQIGFACVLLTPDDEGHVVGDTQGKRYRARQNVVLELGMVLARLGRKRVAILHKESVDLPSDINGLLYIPFTERVEEARTALFRELENAGYRPRSEGLR